MSDKEKTPEQHLRKAKIYRGFGLGTIAMTTTGGFFAYQSAIDWQNFKQDLDNFVVVQEETIKLNLAVALPFLIGIIVFLIVMRKKNKEFFADKTSMGLFIAIMVTYLIYSVVEVTLFSLMGAFTGSLIDEAIFNNLAKKEKLKAGDQKEIDMEYNKEQRRILARDKARHDIRGV